MTSAPSSKAARLADDRGSVAVETILSAIFMLIVIVAFWAAAVIVHNQSTINGASQQAAQSALGVYDRETYRGIGPGTSGYLTPTDSARNAADAVFRENTRGMLAEPYDRNGRPAAAANLTLSCGSDITRIQDVPADANNCGGTGAAVEHARVTGASSTGFWLLGSLANSVRPTSEVSDPGTAQQGASGYAEVTRKKTIVMRGVGDAVSVGPSAVPPQGP